MAVATLVASLGLVMFTGSPAAASYTIRSPHPSCSGSLVGHYHTTLYRFSMTLKATAFVYYSSANGGTNCVWLQKDTLRGTSTSMDIDLQRCSSGSPRTCLPTQYVDDPGSWKYYAGPVRVTRSAGKCIRFRAQFYDQYTAWYGPVHCG